MLSLSFTHYPFFPSQRKKINIFSILFVSITQLFLFIFLIQIDYRREIRFLIIMFIYIKYKKPANKKRRKNDYSDCPNYRATDSKPLNWHRTTRLYRVGEDFCHFKHITAHS